jgi:hypothetical protein
MVNAADFDRKMLLLATQISHESEMKPVLLSVLEALLKTLKIKNSGEAVVEAMTLIRCIIRLVLKLLVEPASNKCARTDLLPISNCPSLTPQQTCFDRNVDFTLPYRCVRNLSDGLPADRDPPSQGPGRSGLRPKGDCFDYQRRLLVMENGIQLRGTGLRRVGTQRSTNITAI